MEEELETLRLGLVELRNKFDEALQRELDLTKQNAQLRREKLEAISRAEAMTNRHRRLTAHLTSLARAEAAAHG